jgi:hypothetical protein
MENTMEVPQKLKKRTTARSSNTTSGHLFKISEIKITKKY